MSSSSRGYSALFWPLHSYVCMLTHTYPYRLFKINLLKNSFLMQHIPTTAFPPSTPPFSSVSLQERVDLGISTKWGHTKMQQDQAQTSGQGWARPSSKRKRVPSAGKKKLDTPPLVPLGAPQKKSQDNNENIHAEDPARHIQCSCLSFQSLGAPMSPA